MADPDQVADDLTTLVRDLERQAAEADRDPVALAAALDSLTAVYRAVEGARQELARVGPEVVVRALVAGLDPADVRDRPYSAGRVRQLAREAGLPPGRPGPRRAVRRTAADMLADMDREDRGGQN